jgi:hypothetical protein
MERKGQEFIQVYASRRIISIRHVCVGCIMIVWVETPSTPLFVGKEGRVYMKDPIGYDST